ncbi:hypothetical protein Tco_0284624, partial [Tanacetum coccineum]
AVSVAGAISMFGPRPVKGAGIIIRFFDAAGAVSAPRMISVRSVPPVRAASTVRMILGVCPV